jgi:hypothetical protein
MLDATLIFDGTLPATGAALTVTRASTNVLDSLVARDMSNGEPDIEVLVKVTTAFTAAGAATLQIAFQGSADNITFHDLLLSPVIPVASLIVGAKIMRYKWPYDQQLNTGVLPDRYYRLNYTVATGPFTAGAIMAYAAADRENFVVYPRNFNVGA